MAFDLTSAGFGNSAATEKIKNVRLEKIESNPDNFYQLTGLDALADSIRMVGLMDPIRVTATEDGKYRIISGHRRFAAYNILAADDPDKYGRIPCIEVSSLDDLDKRYALICANSTARELTLDEKLQQEAALREILTSMKKAGKKLPASLSQTIADGMGVSRTEVSKMHSINTHLIPEAREKVASGALPAEKAYEMSRKPEQQQRSAMSFADQIANDYAAQIKYEHAVVVRFVDQEYRRLINAATSDVHDDSTRQDLIGSLKKELRNSDTGGRAINFNGMPNGLKLSYKVDGKYQHIKATYTEIFDELTIQTLISVAHKEDDDMPHDTWHTGKPRKPGHYFCTFTICGQTLTKNLWLRDDGQWYMDAGLTVTVAEPFKLKQWVRLPD